MTNTGIESEVVRFLESTKKDLILHFSKEMRSAGLAKDLKLKHFFDQIYQSLIDAFKTGKKNNIDVNKVINDLVDYVDKKQLNIESLVKIGADLRYIIVKQLFLKDYPRETQYKIWMSLISRIDWLQMQMFEYSFALYKKHLRNTEAKYRRMVEKIQEGLIIVNKKMEITYCNNSLCNILERTKSELKGEKIQNVIGAKEYKIIRDYLKSLSANEITGRSFELKYDGEDGIEHWIEITPSLMFESRKITGFQATVREVSDRKVLESKLKDRYEKMQQAYLELGKVNRQMASLIDISSILSTDLEPKEVFDFILSSIAILAEADTATLRKLSDTKKNLDLIATYKMEYMWEKTRNLKVDNSVSGSTIALGEPIKIDDMSADSTHKYYAIMYESNLRSIYALPLIVAGKPVGVLTLYSFTPAKFKKINEELITALVGQASIALKVLF